MKNTSSIILLGALFVLISGSVFTVGERELAIKFRFGEIVRDDYDPGLHFKFPDHFPVTRKFRLKPVIRSTDYLLSD